LHLTIYFCVACRNDAPAPVLERLLVGFPSFDARLFVEDEDPHFQMSSRNTLGPSSESENQEYESDV
jgi:ceramide glucosyltransferase